jgi:uncharacterized protein involved in type VI secretion and phage assembly
LMEEEGVYYYFTHSDGKHTLVLCDSYSSHDPLRDGPTLGISSRTGFRWTPNSGDRYLAPD